MAEQDNSQEKTLDPTQKRLDKAKEDGEILSSKEMFVFGSSFMGLIVLFILYISIKNFKDTKFSKILCLNYLFRFFIINMIFYLIYSTIYIMLSVVDQYLSKEYQQMVGFYNIINNSNNTILIGDVTFLSSLTTSSISTFYQSVSINSNFYKERRLML